VDAQGQIISGNPESRRIWGGAPQNGTQPFSGLKGWRLDNNEPLDPQSWPLLRAQQSGQPILNEELTIEAMDGERRIILDSSIPLHSSEEKVIGAVMVIQDISLRKQMEAELKEVQRLLEESREAERVYIARELHDLPMQELYTAHFALAQLADGLAGQERLPLVVDARESVSRANRMLREICNELRPPILENFGLKAAIESHARTFQNRYPELVVQLSIEGEVADLPSWMGLGLFRIYQQALDNVVQHAAATQVMIRLWNQAARLTLEVEDNGTGFVVPDRWIELARGNHLGVVGSVERAAHIGGQYEIISAPGAGTVVRLTMPLHDNR
jgi:signal transduction histidine kinase